MLLHDSVLFYLILIRFVWDCFGFKCNLKVIFIFNLYAQLITYYHAVCHIIYDRLHTCSAHAHAYMLLTHASVNTHNMCASMYVSTCNGVYYAGGINK